MFNKDTFINTLLQLWNGSSSSYGSLHYVKLLIVFYMIYYAITLLINTLFITIYVKKGSNLYNYFLTLVNKKYQNNASTGIVVSGNSGEVDYLENTIRWVRFENTFVIIDTIQYLDKIFNNPFNHNVSDDHVAIKIFRVPIWKKSTQQVVDDINEHAINQVTQEETRNTETPKNVNIYTFDGMWMKSNNFITNTDVFMPVQQSLKEHILSFYKNKEIYRTCGRPYNKVIVLSGPPGTGKSSAVRLIASITSRNIYSMDISTLTNKTFGNAITTIPPNNIVLLDEFDMYCIKPVKNDASMTKSSETSHQSLFSRFGELSTGGTGGVTIDNFLNFIDGNTTPMDTIICIVANDYQSLVTNFNDTETYNAALSRRFVNHYQFKYFTISEALDFLYQYNHRYSNIHLSDTTLDKIKHDITNSTEHISLSVVTELIFKYMYNFNSPLS